VSPSPTRKPRLRKRFIAKRLLYCPKLGHPSSSGYRDAAQVFRGFNRCRRRLPAIWSSGSASFRTSTSRMGYTGCLWRLLRPAYGRVESGRLWQLAIEKLIYARDLVVVPGASQVFVLRQSGTLKMLIVKMVDDILVCGPPDEIQAFNKDLSRTYKLNPFRAGSRVRFSGMGIVTENDGSTTIYVAHYLAACSDTPMSAKGESSKTTNALRTSKRALLRPTYSCALLIFAFPIYARQMLLCEICALSKLR
jgi:hypothetical protein